MTRERNAPAAIKARRPFRRVLRLGRDTSGPWPCWSSLVPFSSQKNNILASFPPSTPRAPGGFSAGVRVRSTSSSTIHYSFTYIHHHSYILIISFSKAPSTYTTLVHRTSSVCDGGRTSVWARCDNAPSESGGTYSSCCVRLTGSCLAAVRACLRYFPSPHDTHPHLLHANMSIAFRSSSPGNTWTILGARLGQARKTCPGLC